MAEKQIGLRININGVNTVVTQIEQLETLLKEAQQDLKQLEIGSPLFKELSGQIAIAQGELEKLNQSSKAITPERQVEGYSKFAAGVTSSFAAATAAVQLFGAESDEVSKATAQAQNLLTLALSARGIAELKTGVQIVATTIATKAAAAATRLETAATTAANVATKAFYTTLAANPYGAILAVVGTLITAFIAFSDETEEAAEQTKTLHDFQLEAANSAAVEATKLKILVNVLNDGNASLDAKEGAYARLQKIIPTLAGYTLQEATAQGLLNDAIEEEVKLIELRAKAKALEDFIVEEEKERLRLAIEQEKISAMSAYIGLLEDYNRASAGGFQGTFEEYEAQVKLTRSLRIVNGELVTVNQETEKASNLQSQLVDVQSQLLEIERRRQKAIDDARAGAAAAAKAEQERIKNTQALISLLGEQARIEAELLISRRKLEDLDVEIVETLEENVSMAESYQEGLKKLLPITQLLAELNGDLAQRNDELGDKFIVAKKAGEKYFDLLSERDETTGKLTITQEKLNEGLENFKKALGGVSEELSPENKRLLDDYIKTYEDFTRIVFQYQTADFVAEDFEKSLIDLALLAGDIKIDPYAREDLKDPRTPEELTRDLEDAQVRFNELQKKFIESYVNQRKKETDLTKFSKEEQEKLLKTYEEAGKVAFNNLVKVGNEAIKFEENVIKVQKRVEDLNAELLRLAPAARAGFIVENAEQFANEYGGILGKVADADIKLYDLREKLKRRDYSEEEKYADSLVALRESFAERRIDLSELTYAQQLILLEEFLNKEVELTNEAEDKKKKKRDKQKEDFEAWLTEFVNLSNQIASVAREAVSFQLENLERRYQASLEMVVGDTKQANDKRIELEQQYNAEKAALEKKSAIFELSLSLVQATANVAEAITRALTADPLSAIIGASLSAAIGAVQIGIIGSQLQMVSSMRRGGISRGPSHEYGGITYAQAGVQLEGNEAVINRQSTIQYGSLLSSINQSGGGRPLVVSSPMDSRLVEVLAKERQTPIRAYVVEQDITRAQTITKKLEQLSTF